jgi:hypothetical protein
MVSNATQLLKALHSELEDIGGYIAVAPSSATYPLVTYTVLSSVPSTSKSFTSSGDIFTVQFSYFDDQSFLNCLDLAEAVEILLPTISDVLDVSKGNLQMVQDTQKSNLYQIIDTRDIEIIKDNGDYTLPVS